MHQGEILLVDDDKDCRELSLRALRKAGYCNVSMASDGVEALGILLGEGERDAADGGEPRFVLLDMRMPKMDGIGVLQRIRSNERTRDLNVIALSALEDPSILEQCRDLGVLAVLPKPLDADTLKRYFPGHSS
jgi:two-component system, response regulator